MPLVPAICTQCGSKLEVDSSKDAAICPYCKTPFVTEKAINHYNTTNVTNIGNIHADVLHMTDDSSRDNRVKSGETFIKLSDYASAEKVFGELTKDCPYDYRGWWGLIRVYSVDFSDLTIDRIKLSSIEQLYQKAIAVSTSDEKKTIESQYKEYYNSVKERLDAILTDTHTKIKNLEADFNRYKSDKEHQIERLTEQKKSVTSPSDVLAIIIFVIIGILVIITMIEEGFWWGILALFILGAIGSGVLSVIGELLDVPSEKRRKEIDSEINTLKIQLGNYTNEHTIEMERLNAILQKVR